VGDRGGPCLSERGNGRKKKRKKRERKRGGWGKGDRAW
jgi:hypothetical protein